MPPPYGQWSPIAFTTNITKIQSIQNTKVHNVSGCTLETNIEHLLPPHIQLKFHLSQNRQHHTHPLHKNKQYAFTNYKYYMPDHDEYNRLVPATAPLINTSSFDNV